MIIKEYMKGKQLTKLEKLKDEIIDNLNITEYNYNFKYLITHKVILEITPIKVNLNNIELFYKDMLEIQKYLMEKKINFSFTCWSEYIKLDIGNY